MGHVRRLIALAVVLALADTAQPVQSGLVLHLNFNLNVADQATGDGPAERRN